jgi:hypothetical protein
MLARYPQSHLSSLPPQRDLPPQRVTPEEGSRRAHLDEHGGILEAAGPET